MGVGEQVTVQSLNQQLTNMAVGMRNLMQEAINLSQDINSQANGLEVLEGIGFDSTANADNPGGVSDAQWAQNVIGFMNNVAEVFFGEAAQPSAFNFDNALAPVYGEQ